MASPRTAKILPCPPAALWRLSQIRPKRNESIPAWNLAEVLLFSAPKARQAFGSGLPHHCHLKKAAALCLRSQALQMNQPGASAWPAEYPTQTGGERSAIGQLRS